MKARYEFKQVIGGFYPPLDFDRIRDVVIYLNLKKMSKIVTARRLNDLNESLYSRPV